ncbi:MAG TPA: hypothetical protein EYN66_06560, partial [Myxococcales bacterium]|nr:hypothetical protein [Myxococcales bacterium]
MYWRLTHFFGEPIVFCRGAWFLDPRAKHYVKTGLELDGKEIPFSVIKQIRIVAFYFQATINNTERAIRCDIGAVSRPYIKPVKNYYKRIALVKS